MKKARHITATILLLISFGIGEGPKVMSRPTSIPTATVVVIES